MTQQGTPQTRRADWGLGGSGPGEGKPGATADGMGSLLGITTMFWN